jgi:hypothetical protein
MALPTLRSSLSMLAPPQVRAMLLPLLDESAVAAISAVYARRDYDGATQERLVAQIVSDRLASGK